MGESVDFLLEQFKEDDCQQTLHDHNHYYVIFEQLVVKFDDFHRTVVFVFVSLHLHQLFPLFFVRFSRKHFLHLLVFIIVQYFKVLYILAVTLFLRNYTLRSSMRTYPLGSCAG